MNTIKIGDKSIFLSICDRCAKFYVQDGSIKRDFIDELRCNHPEADTRVLLQLTHASSEMPDDCTDLVARASDTDVFIILLDHAQEFNCEVWLDTGNKQYVSISKIASPIGLDMCRALPGFHALTGCDYTAPKRKKETSSAVGNKCRCTESPGESLSY